MRILSLVFVMLLFAGVGTAQAPAPRPYGNLAQLMKGTLFPASNVIFAVQDTDPATWKPEGDASASTSLTTGVYSGWQAVENAAVTLSEVSNLLTLPGRSCQNGRPVPVNDAEWRKFSAELAAFGQEALKVAQAKNLNAFLDVADKLTTACGNCHDMYREKPTGIPGRCVK
jgi:cytochrome c556